MIAQVEVTEVTGGVGILCGICRFVVRAVSGNISETTENRAEFERARAALQKWTEHSEVVLNWREVVLFSCFDEGLSVDDVLIRLNVEVASVTRLVAATKKKRRGRE